MHELVQKLVQGRLDAIERDINWQRESFEVLKREAHKADQTLGELIKEKQALVQALGLVPGPRVWQSLDEVPHDVDVRSAGGCKWRHYPKPDEGHDPSLSGWMWSSASGDPYDRTAPFTEVTE
ncbi:hypothetical protein TIMSHEL_52 [Mycobacterium phage Timshel]|uniref:Uncharacterized protein n=1 Tax=Mycobacterium phage Timshel TaxID=1032895 RepID=G1DB70_9CAUD|nr:hypothetical protein FDI10_gp42 [Mycobacterium phage Timshel]AEJ92381.1 hypothetical protein TIMSHEL_52 [Mycobacterium phage Timshel]